MSARAGGSRLCSKKVFAGHDKGCCIHELIEVVESCIQSSQSTLHSGQERGAWGTISK